MGMLDTTALPVVQRVQTALKALDLLVLYLCSGVRWLDALIADCHTQCGDCCIQHSSGENASP